MTWKLKRWFSQGKMKGQCHKKTERILGNKLQHVFLLYYESHTEVPLSTSLWYLCLLLCFEMLTIELDGPGI